VLTAISENSWVIRSRSNSQTRLRLFCFPYAGAGPSIFRTWSNSLPEGVEVCRIQLPGRENRFRELPFAQLPPLVEALARVLKPYLSMPYAFFGHSVGALVAFELARQVRRQYGVGPAHLFVSGRGAPQIPDPDPPIHQLPDAEFMEELGRRYDGIPEAVRQNAELMEVLRPILRADVTLSETYRYTDEPVLACPISCFGAARDPSTTWEELDAWRAQTSGAFKLRIFPGNHFFINTARNDLLRAVVEDLQCSLAGASSKAFSREP
jgi:medium-chain acyl-[acyl-carrier-protein] hydrolase